MRYIWFDNVIYSNSQPRLGKRKINGGRKFSEIKVQKTRVQMFVIDWNLARCLGKTYCIRKCKKNGYREFDHGCTLRLCYCHEFIRSSLHGYGGITNLSSLRSPWPLVARHARISIYPITQWPQGTTPHRFLNCKVALQCLARSADHQIWC